MSRRGALLLSAVLLLGLARSAAAQIGYIAFGDSITFGVYDDPQRVAKGYPGRLETLLQSSGVNAVVVNSGVPGEDTTQAMTRIDGVLAESGQSGDVLLLMEGTNDLSRGIDIETTRYDLNQMALKAENRGLSVVHATTIPRKPNAKHDPQNVANLLLNQNIRDMAGLRERRLADPFEVFSATPNLFPTYYYQGSDDPVGHPNAVGYDLLAQVFFDVLRGVDKVPPVTGLISPEHGAKGVSPTAPIEMDLWDFGLGIDLAATTLLVDGVATAVAPTGDPHHAHFSYTSPTPLSGTVSVGLRSRDLADPANSVDKEIARFTVAGATTLEGDIDQDGRVDGADLLLFARRFGARIGDALYLAAADFNQDEVIDGLDLAVLAANFGHSVS